MTPKQVTKIDFKEIKNVEITCSECTAVITIPLPKDNLPSALSCAGCNRSFWEGHTDPRQAVVLGIMRVLSNLQRSENKQFALGFSITSETVL